MSWPCSRAAGWRGFLCGLVRAQPPPASDVDPPDIGRPLPFELGRDGLTVRIRKKEGPGNRSNCPGDLVKSESDGSKGRKSTQD